MIKKNSKHMSMVNSRQRRKDVVLAYLEDHPCSVCGFHDPRALEFHHRDRSTKTHTIGVLVNSAADVGVLLAEIEKCDILCANCHKIHHAEERGWFIDGSDRASRSATGTTGTADASHGQLRDTVGTQPRAGGAGHGGTKGVAPLPVRRSSRRGNS